MEPNVPIGTCPGPCDVTSDTFLKNTSPDRPAAVYGRGETVTVKYSRNNHSPGGFVRLTLVPLDKMMDEETHKRNAFHYSCWGANTAPATRADIAQDRFGFNVAGSDRALYNVVDVTIPTVVPDGDYVLGWAWFGGIADSTGGQLSSKRSPPKLFADNWSCSFVRVSGGKALQSSYKPVFVNDMTDVSTQGCFSAFDDTGICKVQPCKEGNASFQKPKAFKDGEPRSLSSDDYKSARCSQTKVDGFCGGLPISKPLEPVLQEVYVNLYTCRYPGFVS